MAAEYPHTLVRDGKGRQMRFPIFITQSDMDVLAREFSTAVDDVFIATYPRSGTTWTEQIVHLIHNQGEQGEVRLTDAVPWLETLPHRPGGMSVFLQTLKGRRFFTTHLPCQLMPDFTSSKGKYIYVTRNPKDVAVSCYHHERSKAGYEGSWDEYFALCMQGQVTYGLSMDHVLGWWHASQNAQNILFLKYEDMQHDLPTAIGQISRFMGVTLGPGVLEKVLTGSTLQAMSSNEKTDMNWIPQREGVPKHYRKGIIGDWRSQFSAEQSEQFDALYRQKFADVDLQFDFGDGLVF